jgi:hypothetical protein
MFFFKFLVDFCHILLSMLMYSVFYILNFKVVSSMLARRFSSLYWFFYGVLNIFCFYMIKVLEALNIIIFNAYRFFRYKLYFVYVFLVGSVISYLFFIWQVVLYLFRLVSFVRRKVKKTDYKEYKFKLKRAFDCVAYNRIKRKGRTLW